MSKLKFLSPRVLAVASAKGSIPSGVYVVAAGEPQQFTTRTDRVMWRQDCAIVDLEDYGSQKFTHLAMDAGDVVGPRELMVFTTSFLESRAVNTGDGKASIVLQLSIPSSAQRFTVPEDKAST